MPVCIVLSISEDKLGDKKLNVNDLKLEEKYLSDEEVKSIRGIISEQDFKRLGRIRILVEQYFFDNLSYDEIGKLHGSSPKTVEAMVTDALQKLLHYFTYPEVTHEMIAETPLDKITLPMLRLSTTTELHIIAVFRHSSSLFRKKKEITLKDIVEQPEAFFWINNSSSSSSVKELREVLYKLGLGFAK